MGHRGATCPSHMHICVPKLLSHMLMILNYLNFIPNIWFENIQNIPKFLISLSSCYSLNMVLFSLSESQSVYHQKFEFGFAQLVLEPHLPDYRHVFGIESSLYQFVFSITSKNLLLLKIFMCI